jgi:transposase InsO family protein
MDARMMAAVMDPGSRGVRALCAELGISRQSFYKWRRRYAEEGLAGLAERSRRPKQLRHVTTLEVDDLIREVRKALVEEGLDGGAATIRWHLASRGVDPVPSEATIWRRLVAMGCVTPTPSKRPKRSWTRFEAARPNDRWQLDMTHWALADGTVVEILNVLDDHSRLAVASSAATTVTSAMVWETFREAADLLGMPAETLTDNGLIFSGKLRGFEVLFETCLRHAGINPITSRPFHPQTCGKVERFQQTLKKWLAAQPPARTLGELQAQLDLFRLIYNHYRPHRACKGTPAARFNATEAAQPATAPIPAPAITRVNTVTVTPDGVARVERATIHLGVRYAGADVTTVRTGNHLVIIHGDTVLRALDLEPDRRYYPSGKTRGGPRQPRQHP